MLTSLNFLNVGKSWPPDSVREIERLARYRDNLFLYHGESSKVNKMLEQLSRIERVAGNFIDIVTFIVEFNYYKLIAKRITDLLFGEPPKFVLPDELQSIFKVLDDNNDISKQLKMITKDIIRFGDGIFHITVNERNEVKLNVLTPSIWFPVVDAMNIKEYKYHVIAFEHELDNDDRELEVQIHDKGFYIKRRYLVKDDKIQRLLEESDPIETGLNDFAIIHIMNEETSDSVYGSDEFEDIISILSEIQVRIGQIAKILDAHASPKSYGPSSVLDFNYQTGESRLQSDNYIVVDENETPPGYLTWDGNIEASLKEIMLLFEQLYIISEMSPALLGAFGQVGVASSEESLQTRMFSTILKLQRYSSMLNKASKKAIMMLLSLETNQTVTMDDISITWKDNLPKNAKQAAEVANIRTGGKATQSQISAIMELDDLTKEAAQEELEKINEDDAFNNPVINGTNDPNMNEPDIDQEGEFDEEIENG